MSYAMFVAGFLTGITVFYLEPKMRPLIRDKFIPWVKSLRK